MASSLVSCMSSCLGFGGWFGFVMLGVVWWLLCVLGFGV